MRSMMIEIGFITYVLIQTPTPLFFIHSTAYWASSMLIQLLFASCVCAVHIVMWQICGQPQFKSSLCHFFPKPMHTSSPYKKKKKRYRSFIGRMRGFCLLWIPWKAPQNLNSCHSWRSTPPPPPPPNHCLLVKKMKLIGCCFQLPGVQ